MSSSEAIARPIRSWLGSNKKTGAAAIRLEPGRGMQIAAIGRDDLPRHWICGGLFVASGTRSISSAGSVRGCDGADHNPIKTFLREEAQAPIGSASLQSSLSPWLRSSDLLRPKRPRLLQIILSGRAGATPPRGFHSTPPEDCPCRSTGGKDPGPEVRTGTRGANSDSLGDAKHASTS